MLAVHRARVPDEESAIRLVYAEIRRLARHLMAGERPGHTLQPTALANEALLELLGAKTVPDSTPDQLIALSARKMRLLLIDYARRKQARKRAGGHIRIDQDVDTLGQTARSEMEVSVAIGKLMEGLEACSERAARVVDLRFFAGLSEPETAAALGVSLSTVQSDWAFARLWLRERL